MAADTQEIHRPGAFKQQNKPHKHGKHKSKGQLERGVKGRVDVKTLSKKNKLWKKKNDRRYLKREEVMAKKRSRGSPGTPPHCVLAVPLHGSLDVKSAVKLILDSDDTASTVENELGIHHISIPRFKQRAEFVCHSGNLYDLLDAVKVADSLLLLLSIDEGLDDYGEHCLSCLLGQGLPSVTLALQGLTDIPTKKQSEVKKNIQKTIERWFPHEKIHSLDNTKDGLLVLRHITSQKLKPVYYRENRPHMLAENIKFEMEESSDDYGTLQLTGYLRGQTLSVNRLIHLPGWGDFQLSQVDILDDPHPLQPRSDKQNRKGQNQDTEMVETDLECTARHTEKANPSQQESLDSEVIPDPMEGEQTWPTEEELAEGAPQRVIWVQTVCKGYQQTTHVADSKERADILAKKKTVRKVPKGTSEYQASWIIDSDHEEDNDDDSEDDDIDAEMEAIDDSDDDEDMKEGSEQEEYENLTITEADEDTKYDETLDMEEEKKIFEKIKEERQHVMFPDEIDTPRDSTARTRFQKYRGLKSYRTSPWDPKENLPGDYARIFQFDNFKRTSKRVLTGDDDLEGTIAAWSYIRVHISRVPKAFMEDYSPGSPVAMFGILPHEQKMSVLNLVLRKCADVTKPIKSKERLIFHIGFRRFSACPVFSQHTNGNKHMFERFLPADTATVATLYGPITFPPAPVLVFQEKAFGNQELVAKGTILSVDPDRIIAKRAVLSGFPYKINKKACVVRYMFFNREDIHWFKPVELRTKWGRRGHIKDALGTHGHMKCIFDGQLKSQDTVLMNLYKRVFPKWTYNPHVTAPPAVKVILPVTMETIEEEAGDAYTLFD